MLSKYLLVKDELHFPVNLQDKGLQQCIFGVSTISNADKKEDGGGTEVNGQMPLRNSNTFWRCFLNQCTINF